MLKLTEGARKELEAYFDDKDEKSSIRVFLANGCGGVKLSLAIDEATEEDETFEQGGFTFMVSKELLELTGDLSIDFSSMGFDINTEKPMEFESAGGGGCSGCSSAGACGT